jgi:hypothetical protein
LQSFSKMLLQRHWSNSDLSCLGYQGQNDTNRTNPICIASPKVAKSSKAVAPQSGAKQKFYCTVYCITLNSNCEAWIAFKNLKKILEDKVRSQN